MAFEHCAHYLQPSLSFIYELILALFPRILKFDNPLFAAMINKPSNG